LCYCSRRAPIFSIISTSPTVSPARATLEPLDRLDRTPVISKHVHDPSNNLFAWTRACQHQRLACIGYIRARHGLLLRSPSCLHSQFPPENAVLTVVQFLPLGILCRSNGWQAGVAGHLGVQVPINVKATSPRLEHCCSRRGKRPI
jgi:hypothetical protein